jgi:hypothetical protein
MRGGYVFYTPDLTISNNHLGVLQSIRSLLGCGRIHKNKNSYAFVIRAHKDVARVAEQLIPRCIIKREKLEYVLSFIRSRKWMNDGPLSSISREELEELFLVRGLSLSSIAKLLGCSKSGVNKRLKKWNIRRPRPKAERI